MFRFVNRTPAPIDSLHLLLDSDVDTRTLSLGRPARMVVNDSAMRYRIYALERALLPR